MLYILFTNSDLSPYFSDFVFGLYRGKFVDIPHVNHFGTMMDLRISNVEDYRTFSIFTPRRLADSLAWSKSVKLYQSFSSAVWEKDICKY